MAAVAVGCRANTACLRVSDGSTATPKPSVPFQLGQRTNVGRQRAQQVVLQRKQLSVGEQHAQLLGERVHAVVVQPQPAQRRVNGRKRAAASLTL